MFHYASVFDQDISGWAVHSVTDMWAMFLHASAFDQNIGAWDTSGVKNMQQMFGGASAFNRDIGDWAVDGVTNMAGMFVSASAFDQDLGDWAVDSVTSMNGMFSSASAFDQDLGWCVADDLDLQYAFRNTPCESRSCGVKQLVAGGCAPTVAPTPVPTTVIVNSGSCDKCKDTIYGSVTSIERDCGSMFRQKAAERWGKWRYSGKTLCTKDSCCASNKKDCCEANGAVWAGYVCAFFVVLCCGYCYYNGLDCSMDTETQGNAVAPAP